MVTGIPKNKHGIADYVYVPVILLAPKLAGFESDKYAATLCRVSGLFVLSYTLLTDANWGAIRLIPYKLHVALDVSLGIFTAGSACLSAKSSKKTRNILFLMGLTSVVVGGLSLICAKNKNDSSVMPIVNCH